MAYAAATQVLLRLDRTVMLRALEFGETRKFLRLEACAFVEEHGRRAVENEAEALQRSNHHFGLWAFYYRMNGTTPEIAPGELLGSPQE